MKLDRMLVIAKEMLKREPNEKRQSELLTLLVLLKDWRIQELEKTVCQYKLEKKFRKVG